jgi:hypothetical protein
MASVALAIEKASSKAVSGELWWESHTQLFYALDKCGSVGGGGGGGRDGGALRRDRVEEEDDGFSHTQAEQLSRTDSRLAQRLRAHHQWLLNTVSGFKAPNSTSKAALSASQIDIGSTHSLEVKPALRQLAEHVSKHLVWFSSP